jgi:hypothetical protein
MKPNPSLFTELRLATPPIEAFANTLRQWFGAAIIGGLIYGPSRAGKSNAIEYVTQRRVDIFGYDIPIITIEWKEMSINEKDFHVRFLVACGHSVSSDRTSNRLIENRLIEYLATTVARSGGSSLIIFIDDAQDMRLKDLGFLANVYNLLKKRKIQQYTFLVGEEILPDLRAKAKAARCNRYIGRFMCADFEFPLIKSERDLAFVFHQYDICGYPKENCVSIIQTLIPKAFKNGWRLEKQAGAIWKGYKSGARSIGKKVTRMTMQSCTILVAQLLQSLARRDAADLRLSEEDIQSATRMVQHLHTAE